MDIEETEELVKKMDRKHQISRWVALLLGIWLFSLPLLPDNFPYLNWVRAEDPNTLYTMLGVFFFVWAIDNWRSTKELKIIKSTLALAKKCITKPSKIARYARWTRNKLLAFHDGVISTEIFYESNSNIINFSYWPFRL
ncbi:hypothetical protein [Microbulbifer sp. JMSA003]|uniref:hypothetical protein n=1 Tax=Microbulbifer sp. JMSA003 TaxID=3243369 RepID=UPI00403A5758